MEYACVNGDHAQWTRCRTVTDHIVRGVTKHRTGPKYSNILH